MKYVLLKKKITMGKSTKSRVLRGGAGLRGAPKGGGGVRKFSPLCGAGRGWVKTKPCGAGVKIPSFGPAPPRPIAIPSWTPYN